MARRNLILALLAALAFLTTARVAMAQSLIEQLVMPGPLAESHAKSEKECGKCHEAFASHSQSRLCLDCHKEIANDRNSRVGYHGRQAEALTQDCSHCHTDHKGRDADIVQLDRDRFDHDLTNYRLVDSHRTVDCAACHTPKKPFHKTSFVCFDCHKKDDPHKEKLGVKCDGCHAPTKWRETKTFDHGKTKFLLEGAHKGVACDTCHAGQLYKDLAQTCVSCHRLQDIHGVRYGEKCDACHSQVTWKEPKFDHDKTTFPLRGAHVKAKCDVCHTGYLYRDKLPAACVSCHKKQDPHKGQLGERCEKCHNDLDWRKGVTFNHGATRFPLIGRHASVPCEQCHRTQIYKDAPLACEKCHADVVHRSRLGLNPACGTCHTPISWSRWRFDHRSRTGYPLTGAHAGMKCETCHATPSPAQLKLPSDCSSCHRKDDPHMNAFGRSCEKCHNTSNWRRVDMRN